MRRSNKSSDAIALLDTAQKWRDTLDTYDCGVALQRMNFKRRFPSISDDALDDCMSRWLAREDVG